MRRALLVAVLALVALPATAGAHATLQGTSPERGAALDGAPDRVVLEFSEPVEAAFGALRVFGAGGEPVAAGEPFRPDGDARRVAVRLPADLAEGGYTVTFRVISADSHPVSGGFVFAYGEGAGPAASVDELLAGSTAGPLTTTALSVVRAVQYGSIALGGGVLVFLLCCWAPGLREAAGPGRAWSTASAGFAARSRALLLAAAGAGTLSAAAAVVLQGAVAAGTSAWAALDPAVVREVLSTRFGTVLGAAGLLWLALLALTIARVPALPVMRPASLGAAGVALAPSRAAWLAIPLAALCAVPALAGHAAAQDPAWPLLATTTLHVGAMAAWLGGIAVLVLAVRGGTRALEDPSDRTRLLAAVVGRFSLLATIAVGVVLATGLVQSILLVEAPANLIETAFGRAVAIKAVLFAGLAGLGWYNRSRLLPALRAARDPGRAGILLRRTLRAELALGIGVLAATGALASYPPSGAESAGPFSGSAAIGPARLELTVDPARVGANELHLYLFSRSDGAQFDATEELTVRAALPDEGIEPIELDARKAGPGHYVVTGGTFGLSGDWKVEVAARVGEFDLHTTAIDVPIDP